VAEKIDRGVPRAEMADEESGLRIFCGIWGSPWRL